ncbi:MAG: ABC transporter permease [Caldilineaceae bacterium]|nr:ABC transporter permease [Caldilineaceae bacterium]
MVVHLVHRMLGALLVLLAVSAITFFLLSAAPGDAASTLAGETASQAQMAALRADLGLDQSLLVRYANFLRELVTTGSLGTSLVSGRPVAALLAERLPYTILLALVATALAAGAGMAVGILAGTRPGTLADTALMAFVNLGLALPTFWVALLLILFFSLRLRWLPVVGAGTPLHLVLPAVTLALPTAAVVARLMRSSLIDVIGADFVRTAAGKGLPKGLVLRRHILRNSLIPVITILGMHLGYLLGGAFIVETVFGWPGLGRLTVQAIFDRDLPVVLGATLTIAGIYVALNLLVDLLHAWLDPRVAAEAI